MKRLLPLLFMFAACAGDGDGVDESSHDPRCVSACPETMQSIEGVGEVCNTASRAQCLDACEARIAGLASTCQSCLLEEACFEPGGCGETIGDFCDNGTATVMGWNGSCSYPCGDQNARINCLKQVRPTREVSCSVEWRAVTECASVCN